MFVIRKNEFLDHVLQERDESIGFVPTMGALHKGHLELIKRAKEASSVVVVSIFVNPKQFNKKEDLISYPRPIEKDIEKLSKAGVDILFWPIYEEVYPEGLDTTVKTIRGPLTGDLEGKYRPGHFKGMMQVVSRLLDIVQPQHLFLGQKDLQQAMIVKKMIHRQGRDLHLHIIPVMRSKVGLALSSRNSLLSDNEKQAALAIYKSLLKAREMWRENLPKDDIRKAAIKIQENAGLRNEYFEIIDGNTMTPATSESNDKYAVTAAYAGTIRLIDNINMVEGNIL